MLIEERLPDFKGQSVVFYIRASEGFPEWLNDGVVLDSPALQKQGDRIFVIGRTTRPSETAEYPDWSDHREACLAWDTVVYYIAIPSDEYYELRKRDDETLFETEK